MAEEEHQIKSEDNTNGDHPAEVQDPEVPQHAEEEQKPEGETAPQREDVCRDFLKNICNRGSRCKFYHPPESKARVEEHINFCIDFQNRGCLRDNCRFVHSSRDEVERYKVTREVTLPLARAIAAVTHGDTIAGIPLCKEFQSGKCLRGAARCRYWHVNVEEERERRARGLPPGPPAGGRGFPPGRGYPPTPGYGGGGMGGMRRPGGPMDDPYGKRPRMEDQRIMDLERRNADLTKEVENLRRELQREHERYEDLYALFRQQAPAAHTQVKPTPAAQPQGYAATYATAGWNPNTASW